MSSNQKNSGIKSTLEFGPVIIFFLAYILFDRYDISLNIYGQTYEGFVLATHNFNYNFPDLEVDWRSFKNAAFYGYPRSCFWWNDHFV